MAVDASQIVIAKGGVVSVAPVGATLPGDTDPRAVLTGFVEVGYVTEDGATFSGAPDILEVPAWQAARSVRREAQMRNYSVSFGLLQWNAANLALAFGGGEAVETAPGVVRYDFPADEDALDELSLVLDWEDQGRDFRLVWERGNVTEAAESNLQRTSAAVLPVTYSVLDPTTLDVPGFLVTNDDSFGEAS